MGNIKQTFKHLNGAINRALLYADRLAKYGWNVEGVRGNLYAASLKINRMEEGITAAYPVVKLGPLTRFKRWLRRELNG